MHNFSLKERASFMKKLAFLLESSISFLQALHFIEEEYQSVDDDDIKQYYNDIINVLKKSIKKINKYV